MKIIITRGLPASGKSTWSKQFVADNKDYKRISRDDLRFMIHDGWLVEHDEATIAARDVILGKFMVMGYNIVLDETYLAPHRVKELNETIDKYAELFGLKLTVETKDFLDTPLETCLKRNKDRGANKHVPEAFIRDYYEKYVKPLLTEGE